MQTGLLEEIVDIDGRAPGTDAERRTANLLQERLTEQGLDAELQAIYVHRSAESTQALHALLGIGASVISAYFPSVGFGILLIVIASCYLDLNSRFYLLRRLLFRRGSQNVIVPGSQPDAAWRVIFSAGYDSPRTGWMKGARARDVRSRLPRWIGERLGVYRVLLWIGLAPLVPLIGARLAGFDPTWLTVLQIIPTVVLIIVAFLLIDSALAPPSPGGSENASGVAACLDLAERFARSPASNLDVWVVLTGASTCFGEGMRAFMREERLRQPERQTAVIELQAVGAGELCFRASQGAGIGIEPSKDLFAALGEIRGATEPTSGDAVAARSAGVDSITLTALESGMPQAWRSTMADLPETVGQETLDSATALAERLVRNLDLGVTATNSRAEVEGR